MAEKRLDRISAEANKLQFGRALLTILFFPFYLIGRLGALAWKVVTYVLASIKVGWQEGNR